MSQTTDVPVNISCGLRTRANNQVVQDVVIVHAVFMTVCQYSTHSLLHLLTVLLGQIFLDICVMVSV